MGHDAIVQGCSDAVQVLISPMMKRDAEAISATRAKVCECLFLVIRTSIEDSAASPLGEARNDGTTNTVLETAAGTDYVSPLELRTASS